MTMAGGIKVSLVAAIGRRGELGRQGRLLFRLSSDLAHFKKITLGKPVVMGRKTWESLPRKPLPGRPNIVVTRNASFFAPDAFVHSTPETALSAAGAMAGSGGSDEVCVIGGAELYAAAMPYADRLILSEVDAQADADAWFPPFDRALWREVSSVPYETGPGDEFAFVVRTLVRAAVNEI